MAYFKFKARPSVKSERQKLISKLDILFSEYIRIRNCDDQGNVECITCGEEKHWTDVQCGHYVKRNNMTTRYHLQNCGEQCSTCNCVHDGRQDIHKYYIDKTYGPGTADKLEKLGHDEAHFSDHELKAMTEELKKELKAVRIEKGM
jgi:hypothetical protein